MDPGPRVVLDAAIVTLAARRRPRVASRRDERDDLSKQPQRSQQPDVHVFFAVAAPEIRTFECARLVKPARAVEEGRRPDEHGAVTNHPDASRSYVFVLRPYNGCGSPAATRVHSARGERRRRTGMCAMSRAVALPTRYTRSRRAE